MAELLAEAQYQRDGILLQLDSPSTAAMMMRINYWCWAGLGWEREIRQPGRWKWAGAPYAGAEASDLLTGNTAPSKQPRNAPARRLAHGAALTKRKPVAKDNPQAVRVARNEVSMPQRLSGNIQAPDRGINSGWAVPA